MRTISLRQFRDNIADIAEPVEVQRRDKAGSFQVLGHWTPLQGAPAVDPPWPIVEIDGRATEVRYLGDPQIDKLRATQTQADRDDILRRINKRG